MKNLILIVLLASFLFAENEVDKNEFKENLKNRLKELSVEEKSAIQKQIQTLKEKREEQKDSTRPEILKESNENQKHKGELRKEDRKALQHKKQQLRQRERELREKLKEMQMQKQENFEQMKSLHEQLKDATPEQREEIFETLDDEQREILKEKLLPPPPLHGGGPEHEE